MAPAQSAEFTKAAEDSRNLKSKPDNDDLLKLYALYKEGCQDPPFAKASKPGMFDLTGKAKYSAWEKQAGEKLSPEDAQKKYVALVESLKGKYGF